MEVNLNQLEIPKASVYATEALEIVSHDDPDLKALESAIMHDPLLASTILRYANSPLNRRSEEITNVPTALRMLGLKSVRSAIVTAAIRSLLPADSELGNTLLSHMVEISTLCKIIARTVCASECDDLEFLGLVHDVGMLTLAANYSEDYEKLVEQSKAQNKGLDQLEKQKFGISHNMVSARTASEFRLPQLHVDLLQHFHSHHPISQISNEKERDTAILALAHLLRYELPDSDMVIKESILETVEQLQELFQISDEQLQNIRNQASDAFK